MTENLDERISYYESPIYAIAKTLKDKGYRIADFTRMRLDEPSLRSHLGILEPREPIKKSFLGFKWEIKQRALYIGTLWVDQSVLGAKPNENWVLEVYGRDNVQKLTELVRELSKPKKVSVQIKLESEQSRVELFEEDLPPAY